ncbi:hypothetical protein YC2023_114052 [Brassica napus]
MRGGMVDTTGKPCWPRSPNLKEEDLECKKKKYEDTCHQTSIPHVKRREKKFRDPRFYPSSCESLPSIATIGGLTEAARLGTSQAELKDVTTRAPIVRFLSCQRAMELKPS